MSQNLSKNFTILCTRTSSHCAWPASTGGSSARRGGLERRAAFGPVAIGGSWSDVPVPATEEAPKSGYSTCQHHHHYQHPPFHYHHHHHHHHHHNQLRSLLLRCSYSSAILSVETGANQATIPCSSLQQMFAFSIFCLVLFSWKNVELCLSIVLIILLQVTIFMFSTGSQQMHSQNTI